MRYSIHWEKHILEFKKPAGTSRGALLEKPSWYIHITDNESGFTGTGECSIIPGLSIDIDDEIEEKLGAISYMFTHDPVNTEPQSLYSIIESTINIEDSPAICFGLETAILDLINEGNKILFRNNFSLGKAGIPINGLIWMDTYEEMWKQVKEKARGGFNCIKIKVGAMDFQKEINLIAQIREVFGGSLTLRLDANGAFSGFSALDNLKKLAGFKIHSIEQPIKPGNWKLMAFLCENSPIPIALDEELIGISGKENKEQLLQTVKPQYIIIKPSLLGGFVASNEWIELAENINIGWCATSALESNIGLNAIAQWVASFNPILPQGLGTGSLYKNNIELPLEVIGGELWFTGKNN